MIGKKQVEIDRHFIKEKLKQGLINTPFVPSKLQVTDIITKEISKLVFDQHMSKLAF